MTEKLSILVSSTVRDLLPDRSALCDALAATERFELLGVMPIAGPSSSESSHLATIRMATTCNIYLLLLGGRYGSVTDLAISATEAEYEAAYRSDPTKIIVFRKLVGRVEARQKRFIARATNYNSGYFVRDYRGWDELPELAVASLNKWVADGHPSDGRLTYFDHFVRMASNLSPFPGAQCKSRIAPEHLELQWDIQDRVFTVHLDKAEVFSDFWGSLSLLEQRFAEWRLEHYGRNS